MNPKKYLDWIRDQGYFALLITYEKAHPTLSKLYAYLLCPEENWRKKRPGNSIRKKMGVHGPPFYLLTQSMKIAARH